MLKHSLIIMLLAVTAAFAAPGRADDSLLPVIPPAQSRFSAEQGCVEPTEDMRKNHMEYILHQRDETMHEGIRSSRHSLVDCINCHVSAAPDAPRVTSKEHFCKSCHSYAAVQIDCFQCHADRPEQSDPHRVVSGTGHARILASEDNIHE
ncbi:MAG: sulfur reduction protein DsrJ [Pseudomonadota bacterium]